MQVIARVVFRQDVLGVARIARGRIEIDHAIKGAAAADPGIDGQAFLFLLLIVVVSERGAGERILEWGERCADDAHAASMRPGDQLPVPRG